MEHVFRIIKCQFGYRKVRYKGLAKNRAQVMSLVALANLPAARLASGQAGRYLSVAPVADGRLTGEVRPKGAKGVKKQQKARCSVLTQDRMLQKISLCLWVEGIIDSFRGSLKTGAFQAGLGLKIISRL